MRWLLGSMLVLAACGATLTPRDDAGSGGGGLAGGGASPGGGDAAGGGEAVGGGEADGGALDSGEAMDAGALSPDAGVDLDRDGLDDADEARIARDYLPVMAVHPSDGCPLGGLLYRVRPHPRDPTLLHVVYVHLFERDCGLNGHVGDDEVFSLTVDPSRPAPDGVTAMKAISHQDTLCQRVTECGSCNGLTACATPRIVFFSKDKHGGYLTQPGCSLSCLDQCAAGSRSGIPLVNAGEPGAPLTEDLTDAGFITSANGWSQMSVFHFNPWAAGAEFGKAGVVADDLVDPAFDTPACR